MVFHFSFSPRFSRGIQQEASLPLPHILPDSPDLLPGHHQPSPHQRPVRAGAVRHGRGRAGAPPQNGLICSRGQGGSTALPSWAGLGWGIPKRHPESPGGVCRPCGEVVMPVPSLPAGAVPQLGGGGPQEHPGHPAGHALPAPPHRPPVRAPAPPAGPLLLHCLLLQGGCDSSRERGCGGISSPQLGAGSGELLLVTFAMRGANFLSYT